MFKKSTSILDEGPPSPSPPTSPLSFADDFNARRSSRVAADRYAPDDDNWVEALAVCESAAVTMAPTKKNGGGLFRKLKSRSMPPSDSSGNDDNGVNDELKVDTDADVAAASQRLTIRPYFQSQRTGQRVWDEPPSGASNIVYATLEARRMAHAQLGEMRSSFAREALVRRQERKEREAAYASASLGQQSFRNADGGFVGRLSRSLPIAKAFRLTMSSASESVDANQSSLLLLGNDSRTTSGRSSRRPTDSVPKSIINESKELASASRKEAYEADLQRAMLMSMGIGGGSVMGVGDHTHGRSSSKSTRSSSSIPIAATSHLVRAEEEQFAVAMALSLSEQEARQSKSTRRLKSSSYTCSESNDSTAKSSPPVD